MRLVNIDAGDFVNPQLITSIRCYEDGKIVIGFAGGEKRTYGPFDAVEVDEIIKELQYEEV